MRNLLARFIRDEDGQDIIEYLLLGTFIALAASVVLGEIGPDITAWYEKLGADVEKACLDAGGAC